MFNHTLIYAEFQGACMDNSFIGIKNAKRYINNWDKWEECFPEEVINWLVNEAIRMPDACAIQYIPTSSSVSYYEEHYKRLPEVLRNFKFIEACGEWTRPHYEDAYQYLVPYRYQTVSIRKIFTKAICKAYPYLKDYKFAAYVPDCSLAPEIYIKIPFIYDEMETVVSMYCPIKAFKDKNPQLIYDRHHNYNADYYKGLPRTKNRILAALDSEEYKALCAKVMEG